MIYFKIYIVGLIPKALESACWWSMAKQLQKLFAKINFKGKSHSTFSPFPRFTSCLVQTNGFFFFLSFWGCPCCIWKFPGQGSNRSCSCQLKPQPQQRGIWASSVNYTTAHGNTGSLTHWLRPGIKPHILMDTGQICFCCTTMGTPTNSLLNGIVSVCHLLQSDALPQSYTPAA